MERAVEPEPRGTSSIRRENRVAWAAVVNRTDEHEDVSVTLLALSVVDGLVRLTGLLRVGGRNDVRMSAIPILDVTMPDGRELPLVDARVHPVGRVAWMSWTYERPPEVPSGLSARIDRVVLEYRGGGAARVDVAGPWEFSFPVTAPEGHLTAVAPMFARD